MGELNRFDLSFYGCDIFIETGTGKGAGVQYASSFPFKALHTIEIIPELYGHCIDTIKDPRINFHLGNSTEILKEILSKINKDDKILFWIDAHFPGIDYGLRGRTYVFDEFNMPLKQELTAITQVRDTSKDTFLIDDLRLYEDGHYQEGNLDIGIKKQGTDFIKEFFINTHKLSRDFRDQGFLILTPFTHNT